MSKIPLSNKKTAMTSNFHFTLDKSSKKFRCPNCGKKRFVKYVNNETGEYLPKEYGRCDRENSCQYHFSPYDAEFQIQKKWGNSIKQSANKNIESLSFIPHKLLFESRKGYKKNNFVKFLLSKFDESIVLKMIQKYHLGTAKYWSGSTIFWQIDINGMIRTGKIMQYNPKTGRRIKKPRNYVTWVHSVLEINDFTLQQCLFGEHLLNNKNKPAAIVESEKTAVIATAYFPQFVWLATGSKSNINAKILSPLKRRAVTLFPDIGAYNDWKEKTAHLSHIKVSSLLEKHADSKGKKEGYDLADYLLQFDPAYFKDEKVNTESKFDVEINDKGYPASWDKIKFDHSYENTKLHKLKRRDPTVKLLIELFDGDVDPDSVSSNKH